MGELITTKFKLSVVIPCYNESNRIEKTIIELTKFFFTNRAIFTYELIFIDDGSTDDTYEKVNYMSEQYPNIRVLTYNRNAGKGFAVRTGLKEAKYDNILILDADLSVKPNNLLNSILWFNFNDTEPFAVIGERIQVIKQPIYRIFAGLCFRNLVKVLFKLPFNDTQNPYKVLHNIHKDFYNYLKTDGFSYDVELLYKLKQYQIDTYKTRVMYFNDTESKVTIKKAIKMFFELLRIRFPKK